MAHALAMPRGAFTISIDVEILWGVWDSAPTKAERHCADLERAITKRLLRLFHQYGVRATWAVVARLLDGERGFDGLRGTPDCWFAPDIVEAIRADAVGHEIGSHSYRHIYFHASTREEVLDDLRRAEAVHGAHGLPFASFVFPRNQIAHLDVLEEVGIKVYRSTDGGILRWAAERAARLRPALNLLEKALAVPSPLVRPIMHDNGLVELPSSMLLMARNGMRRLVHPRALERKITDGVRRAAGEGSLFHLWFHPSNFYDDPDVQFGILERGLAEAAALRDRGQLDIRTMGDFVELADVKASAGVARAS
jgi:peptidoglycan/xylan/chitin deacetylase (PgdA/CDA1 family)